ncbi:MAG: CPBP family intramembrane metalloprotease [Bacteroidales bacterium]|nr:CPBP family intramembrane metalloprotease [Bacteroidales bacterium]
MLIDFNDLISFLKSPDPEQRFEIKTYGSFLRLLWSSFVITLLISFIISLIISTPLRYLDLLPSIKNMQFQRFNILKMSLFVPVIEELIFRLPLRISKVNLSTSFGLLLFLVFQKININIALLFLVWTVIFLVFNVNKKSDSETSLRNISSKLYLWIFYFQAILFGLLHLSNFNLNYKYFYLFPFYILIYVLIGCFWGYIRVRYNNGIFACILTHILINSLYCLLILR